MFPVFPMAENSRNSSYPKNVEARRTKGQKVNTFIEIPQPGKLNDLLSCRKSVPNVANSESV